MHFSTAALLSFTTLVYGHGLITSPPSRPVGDAIKAACGPAIAQNIQQDNTSHVEGLPEIAAQTKTQFHADQCNLWLCKGLQYKDNAANVQNYKVGDTVNIKVYLRIPHKGSANVSIVDTKSNTIIGQPLFDWPSGYADENQKPNYPKNQTDFDVKIPDLGGKCTTPGECVSLTAIDRLRKSLTG
jgi:hypothetical protein